MICRTTRDKKQTLIGITKAEVDLMLADRDKCIHVYGLGEKKDQEITVYVVDGDDDALEEEFLRIVAISAIPDPGAKPQ